MKKIILAISVLSLVSFSANAIERKIGVTAALSNFDSTGTETLKSSNNKTTADVSETVIVPSIFFEVVTDNGVGVGLDYVPAEAEIGSKSQTKTDTDTDDASDTSGTNTAAAEVSGHTTLYLTFPVREAFLKIGYVRADVDTTENLATGTTYGNKSVNGTMVSLGIDRDLANGKFFRAELAHTDYSSVSLTGSADSDGVSNQIEADVDSTALRLSIGKTF